MLHSKWFLFIVLIVLVILLTVLTSRADERQWYSYSINNMCIEISAKSIEQAECAMDYLIKERKYPNRYTLLESGCPGMLADDYFHAFSFKCNNIEG